MSKLINLIVVFGVFALAKAIPVPTHTMEQNFANYLLKSSLTIEENPQRSMACFQIYVPKLNDLTEEYEIKVDGCLRYADDANWSVEKEMNNSRWNATRDANDSCELYKICNFENNTLEFFDCYAKAANNVSKVSSNIEKSSKDNSEYMKIKLETIAYEKNRCTTEASRVYKDETSKIYADLDDCLAD